MCAGRQTHLAVPRQAGIGQETRGRGHLASLQTIEPVPDRQTGEYNTTNITSAAKTGQNG